MIRLLILAILLAGAGAPAPLRAQERSAVDVVEASIPDLQRAMQEGRATARDLVVAYLTRIATYEDRLNAVMYVNPAALAEADRLDGERAAGRVRGPLHGIPVALKDNIHTTDMPTTGGALAFAGYVPPYEATITRLLREAGAIVLAKTQMTEWANGLTAGMPGNYNAVSGYGMNPYDPRRDPREQTGDGRPVLGTGGSSSGVGTAVSFWAANVGTETSGSILSPSNQNMLVGIKPTVGRISRWGVIPLNGDQDTAGPMARTVTDAAILMGVLEGAAPDPNDPATTRCERPAGGDYTRFLDAGALRGARIGIPRAFWWDPVRAPGDSVPRGGLDPEQRAAMAEAIAVLERQGAVIVDPADVPSVVAADSAHSFFAFNGCGDDVARRDCALPGYAFTRDFAAWLASLGPSAPIRNVAELLAWNQAHARAGAIRYGQTNFARNDRTDLIRDRERYESDRATFVRLSATEGIDAAMREHRLDALLFPGATGAAIAARPGYPSVIVPFATVPNAPEPPLPDGFDARPAPFGVTFTGGACSEARLIALAYAFEQATRRRVAPPLFP